MYVVIIFGVFNDFAIKSPVGALAAHKGICEVAAEHSRGLVGDFRRLSVDVWCLNGGRKKIELNTLFINIPSNKTALTSNASLPLVGYKIQLQFTF